jgi:hypothetical protein
LRGKFSQIWLQTRYKSKGKKNPFMFLATYWIYFPLKSGEFGLFQVEIIFFRLKFGKNLSIEEISSIEKVAIIPINIRPNLAINHI